MSGQVVPNVSTNDNNTHLLHFLLSCELAGRLVAQPKTNTFPPLVTMLAVLLTSLAMALTATSRLTITRSPDEQLPLIARVNKPYSWSLSSQTFNSTDGKITYSTSALPPWLSFDPGTLTFHGTPSAEDEGYPRIILTAQDSLSKTVSSEFTICVSSYPEPTVGLPVSQQFSRPAPSLSSVFIISPHSALSTGDPALRIPPKWSFSVGFEYETYKSDAALYYDVRQRDGSSLPAWMAFDSGAITVNGVTPKEAVFSQPDFFPLALYVSDQEGYSAFTVPFDLILAEHELSLAAECLPTINITKETPFSFTFSSPADFSGVLMDGRAIQPSEIVALIIDTSQCGNWLKYDRDTRTLSGDPGNDSFVPGQKPLRANIATAFNQSIEVPFYLATVPSCFTADPLPPIQGTPGLAIQFNLNQGSLAVPEHDDINITAAYEPHNIGVENWLKFTPESGELAGAVPLDFSATQVTVTFTAYSHVTHSTSHTSLLVVFAPPGGAKIGIRPSGLSSAAHSRLVLGLGITFGVIGGLCVFGGLLAAFRHCARVEDTAVGGEEGRNVWNEQDKIWYGVGTDEHRGYGWSNHKSNSLEKSYNFPPAIQELHLHGYPDLGLRRVSERSQSQSSPMSNLSPGVIRKREFFKKLRNTVRVVSDRAQGRKVSRQRPLIGNPIPTAPIAASAVARTPSGPFEEFGLPSHPGSTVMTNSPSASTTNHSIPRRRPDFAPPKPPFQVHFDVRPSRQPPSRSKASNTENQIHAAETVLHTRSRSLSISSSKSSSSYTTQPVGAGARPRLVPFTSASRVPVPHHADSPPGHISSNKRVISQTAKVWKADLKDGGANGETLDELKMGLHYAESLGVEPQSSKMRPR